jgi:mycothiol system anti-sigma-R factor
VSCGDSSEIDCGEVIEWLFEYLDGELGADRIIKIKQHLDECGSCLTEHEQDLLLKALIRRSCGGECAPERLRAKILLHINEVRLQLD